LIETFIEKSEDPQLIANNFVPPLLAAILVDYKSNISDARDPEVLSVMAVIINKLKSSMLKEIPRVLDNVFECTLDMITKNFQDYPEHRLYFFTLIRAINQHCFQALFSIPPASFKLIIDSVVWAFKHTERNISETGLNILLELLKNISAAGQEVSNLFYKTYFLSLLQDVFYVLTDTFHKSGFKLQGTIFMHMFGTIESGAITVPLWDTATVQDQTMMNQRYMREYVGNMLRNAFPNLTNNQITNFVVGLFDPNKDLTSFKVHLRDFLVQLKEFTSGNNEELYEEEKEAANAVAQAVEQKRVSSVPGLLPQSQLPDDMND